MNVFLLSACLLAGALWGVFLQVVACALLDEVSFFKSFACAVRLKYLFLGICFGSAFIFTTIFLSVPIQFWASYITFASALIINTRTDLQEMVIMRWASLFVVPVGWLFAYCSLLPITLQQSIVGSLVGYGALWLVERLFYAMARRTGIGQGDFELLALIGAFTGIYGVHASLLIGSIVGTIAGLSVLLLRGGNIRQMKVPFGPFLALGAIVNLLGAHISVIVSRLV